MGRLAPLLRNVLALGRCVLVSSAELPRIERRFVGLVNPNLCYCHRILVTRTSGSLRDGLMPPRTDVSGPPSASCLFAHDLVNQFTSRLVRVGRRARQYVRCSGTASVSHACAGQSYAGGACTCRGRHAVDALRRSELPRIHIASR